MRFLHSLSLFSTAATIVLVGCSSGLVPSVAPAAPVATPDASAITGNWQLASSAPSASKLPELSGQLTGSSSAVTGIFHSNSTSSCVASSETITLSGSESAKEVVSLTGQVAGGMLTVSGTLSADGRTLTSATYNVTGGTCAFLSAAAATVQSYSPVTGTYMGTFTDVNGHVTDITASITQSPTSDSDGNFLLSGTSTLPITFVSRVRLPSRTRR